MDVLVRTFNSAPGLRACLQSIRERVPVARLIVVDRNSTDATVPIAREFGAEVQFEERGLGEATNRALAAATTDRVLFVDSDVTIVRPDFYARATDELDRPGVGAVVGTSVGHRFLYGLPLGLTLLPRRWASTVAIPSTAQGAETYYFRRALRRQGLRVRYVAEAMVHRSIYRGRDWPEWQGAQIRAAAGWSPREVVNSLLVVVLIHLNSRQLRNVAYTPVFYAKFLRGYLRPETWQFRDRRVIGVRAGPP
ncbi:MAG: glycosyltransferase [Thermoplasmata archaeon]|nr:glycosyltransferase [Thermoplasmata archaeon]